MSSNNDNHVIEDEDAVGDVSTVIFCLDCKIIWYYYCLITDHLPSITHLIDDVVPVIEVDIENDEYITNAIEAIEKYYNVSILMHFYIHIIINYFIINHNVFIVTDERIASTGCAINITQPRW